MGPRLKLAASLPVLAICFLQAPSASAVVSQAQGNIIFQCRDDFEIKGPDCYLLVDVPMTYELAEDTCKTYGARLVEIRDEVEAKDVGEMVPTNDPLWDWYWIGNVQNSAQDACSGYWMQGEPKDVSVSSPIYVAANRHGRWMEKPVMTRLPFVCHTDACVNGTFGSRDGKKCISNSCICDGIYDSDDQSDESDCASMCRFYIKNSTGTLNENSGNNAGKTCTWVIQGAPGQPLSITFPTINVEEDTDYLEVWSGSPSILTSTLLARLTGTLTNKKVYGINNFLIIRLVADVTTQQTGFTASWQPDDELSPRNRQITATETSSELTSPDYDSNSPPTVYTRQYTISTDEGSLITLKVMENGLGEGFEYDPETLSNVNGKNVFPEFYVSRSNTFTIYLVSDGCNGPVKFKAEVQKGCAVDFTRANGFILPPNFNNQNYYPPSVICTYTIHAPDAAQRTFQFSFTELRLADGSDSVKVFNGSDITAPELDPAGDAVFSSTVPNVFVQFVSSLVQTEGFFNLTFNLACPAISNTDNMAVSSMDTQYGTNVTLSCNTGFAFAQKEYENEISVTITCDLEGKWNVRRMPTCAEIYCGVPEAIPNGFITSGSGNAKYGASVVYQCYAGFSMSNSNTSTCGDGSTWSLRPTCAASQCGAVPQLADGNYTTVTGSGTDFGTIIHYDCDPGFDLIGSRFILCKTDTTWSHEAPVCQRIKCPMPEVDNGQVTGASGFVEFEGQLTVECNTGFVILGDMTLTSKAYTCLSSGQFEFERDVCVDKDDCAGTNPCTGQNEECKNTIGNYTCECKDKYKRVGDQCQVINRCTTQTSGCDLENGDCTATNNDEDYVCSCKIGYVLFTQNGTSGRYIPFSEDGQTPGDVYYLNHTCVPLTCGPPPNVTNGRALTSKTTFDFDDSVEYRCDFGYKPKAGLPTKLSCTESDWGMPIPICEPVTCGALVATGLVLNIYPNRTTNPGEKVVLECNSESTDMAYNKTLFCALDANSDTFELQGDKPHCPVVDCGDVGNIGGANFSPPDSTRLNASFIFNCTPGFTKEGSSTNGNDVVTCEKNGRWGLGSLTCIGTRCTDPGTPGGMNQTEANFEVGGMVVYTCQRGGFRPNPLNRTCLYNASSDSAYWDSTSPICEDVEKPVFTNCSGSPVRVKLYGSLSSVIATPSATDNSDLVKVTVTPEWLTPEVGFDLGSQLVTYTATDAAGNSASCSFTVETYDPSTLPSLNCPDYLTLKVNTTSPYVVSLETHVTGDSESTLVYSPESDVVVSPETVGTSVYRVTATNTFGFQRQCAFIVHIEASSCLSTFITTGISSKNAAVSCDTDIGNMQCTVTCNSGFAYHNGLTSMTYSCQGENEWTPAIPARYCSSTGDAQYIFEVEVDYSFTAGLITNCENTLRETLKTHIPQQNITFCYAKYPPSLPMKFNVVSVDFNSIIIQTMKARIILAVTIDPEDVDRGQYDICEIELGRSFQSDALFNVFPGPTSCSGFMGNLTAGARDVIKHGNSCLSGYVLTTVGGTEKCVQCEPGSYFNGTQCAECADGKYQDQPGQLECKDCENGASHSTKPRLSSDQCVASCPHGFSNNQTFSPMPAKCLACPEDSYLDTDYTALCTPCNNGTITFGVEGATSQGQCKAQCPAGQYPVNNTACAVCPRGYYKSSVDNTACTACSMSETTSATQTTTSNDCDPVPNTIICENGGTPMVDFHRNFCACPDGYSGSSCEVDVNACDSSPCYNGGSCTSTSPINFTCSCQFQQTCSMVQNDIPYNSAYIFLHQASLPDLNDCLLLCLDEFPDCAVLIFSLLTDGNNLCLLYNATQYTNGTKDAGSETYLKTCSQQYLFEGPQCEIDVRDDCTNLTCEDRSFCRDLIDRADCVCPSDSKYMQPRCTIDLNVCDPNPCKNGAECSDSGNGVRATCICPPGFDGDLCDNNIDECEENPDGCLYGGQCQDGIDDYSCICSPYSGDHCENMPNFCSTQNACDNGICYNDYNVSSAVCVCEYPYQPGSSDQCEEINICDVDNPCINNSTCNRVTVGETSCQCQEGYTGSRCQHNINDCSSNPCANGTCIDLVSGFRCQCDPGYDGDTCANNINDCQNATCIPASTERYEDLVQYCKCVCKVGFTGMYCETPINECQSFPCQHNGTCSESTTPGQYNCACVDGWTGSNCENLTDFCTPDPCENNGLCYSLQDNYFCNCESGTFGETCQQASELCDILNPCTDVSLCEKSGGTAVCECPRNYTGGSCNLIEDICSDTPCANGGTCVTLAIGYTCQCADGYSGENCTTKADPCLHANCPGGSSCIVEDDEIICLCGVGQLKSGSSCKEMSNDFDIYFTRSDDSIRSYQPFYLNESSFTIMFWIAPLQEDSPEAPVQLRLSNGTTVLAVDKSSVTFGDKPSVPMKDNTGNKPLIPNKWNQVTVIWAKSGSYSIIVSGLLLDGGTTDADFPLPDALIFVYIGEKFSGYISQLLVWKISLNYTDTLSMYSSPSVPEQVDNLVARWTGYRLFNNLWARIVSPSIVKANIAVCDDGRLGDACDGSSPDKESPVLPFCPYNGTFDDTDRLVQIGTSLTSAFFDPQIISNLDSTLLTFGAHRVVFMKKDEQNNVGFCRFTAYVRREGQSCDNTEGLNPSNIIPCDGKGQKVQCPNGGRAPLSPNILTCGLLGSYNLDVPGQLPPAVVCGSIGTKHFTVEVTAIYTLGINCGSSTESPVVEALKQKVVDLDSTWFSLCEDNNCNNAGVTAKCDGASTRNIKATITIESVPATLTSNGVTLTAKELLQTAVLELDSFKISTVFGAQLQKDTMNITDEPSCDEGFGLHDDECVECGKGSFLNETTKMCELCPIGSITDSNRQTSCSQCPPGQTTLQLGADHCNASCPSGQYLNASDQCQECAKNFYQNATGQVTCLPCPAGTITETTGSTSADLCYDTCNAGTELKNSTCVPCARGFYRDGVNQDQMCEPCPVGNTTRGEGSPSITHCYQTACSEGHFRNSTTNECGECDYGFFQPKKWQDNCEECNASYTTVDKTSTRADQCKFICPAGQENLSGTSCTACNKGYYRTDSLAHRFINCSACNSSFTTSGEGSQLASDCNIRICNAGYYRNTTDNQCYLCPIGKYQPDSLQDMCLNCSGNTTTKQMGSENKTQCVFFCAAGYEVLSAENQTCKACERGYYKSNDGDNKFNKCKKCDGSNTTDSEASVSAMACDIPICQAGQYISNSSRTCEDCPEDYYQPQDVPNRDTGCQLCPSGTGTREARQSSENACYPVCGGGQQYNSSSSQCEPCPLGTWNSGNSSQRFDQCASCQTGYVTVNEMTGATSADNCTLRNCPTGSFIDGADDSNCTLCPVGYYQDLPRQKICSACRTDTNTSGEGSKKESDCTVSCPAGRSQVSITNETCVLCEADKVKPSSGPGTCVQCTGNYTSNDARTNCDVLYCDRGYRYDSGGMTCKPCEVGKYKVNRGKDEVCQPCLTNTTTAEQASISPSNCSEANCDVGLYSPNGTLPCLACPVGRFKNSTGNQDCTPCTGAFTTEGMGSTSATDCTVVVCPMGQFRQNNQCVNCSIGSFQNETGQTDCYTCPTGYTTTVTGSTRSDDCKIVCSAGKYRDDNTNTCMDCLRGQYQENTGETSCNSCDTDYTTANVASNSSSDCFIVCPVGEYSTSRTTCEVCPHGKYQSFNGSSSCDSCADGNTTLQTKSTSAADCQPICNKGYYLNVTSKSCVACGLGSYNPYDGNMTTAFTSCQTCTDGNTTAATGSVSQSQCDIKDCLPGSFRSSNEEGCEECPLGKYQPQKSQLSCEDCPSGMTTLEKGRHNNDSCVSTCEDGHEFIFANKTCEPCKLDYYRKVSEGLSCNLCEPGYTTLMPGESNCIPEVGDPQPRPPQSITIFLTIRIRIGVCINKEHLVDVIHEIVISVFLRVDSSFPSLCVNRCDNIRITFNLGCLNDYNRRKRSAASEQLVDIELSGVNDEITDTNSKTHRTETVVGNAFYDLQPEENLLNPNQLEFLGVESLTSTAQCQPGQFNDGSGCEYCSAGTYSDDGVTCSQCEMNFYQNGTGQSSCFPCPEKTFTSSMGSTDMSNCTKKCDEPDARTRYCSGHGACLFSATAADGVLCECDDNYSGDMCEARKSAADDKTKMIAGIAGGAGAFLLLVLLVIGVVACLKRASQKGKKHAAGLPREYMNNGYIDDGTSEQFADYNYPMYRNGMQPMAGAPAVMYINPAVDHEMHDFYSRDRSTAPPSRTRSRSYESEWRDVDGAL